MIKVLFIAKTNINTDGRILNQINILKNNFKNLKIDFILFPDKEKTINLGERVTFHIINTKIRNIKFLRPFTVIDFTLKAYKRIKKIKPEIIHAQDSAIVIPVLLYRIFSRKKFFLIYDDHELPNENESVFNKFFYRIEKRLMKKSDAIIFANEERQDYLREKYILKNNLYHFLNLPYSNLEEDKNSMPDNYKELLQKIDTEINNGITFIIHQGPMKVERGREKLAAFAKKLPEGNKLLLLGGSKEDFEKIKDEYKLNNNKFLFVGNIDYKYLTFFWKRGKASVVMYLPTYINNRLCAPNRLYLSYFLQIPTIVNKDNIVLSTFIQQNNCGLTIEDYHDNPKSFLQKLMNIEIEVKNTNSLLLNEEDKLTSVYKESKLF
ncbi:glycosyltransferase [uncultured Tenacibaculum sp.]|uniref:glycosyltransferase n=1 Tax=uncultured Tenacibaculum sp. TaxID=174713 RepID=UPI002628BF32|nr:glycosyltransferase [uncultured Tenacibaculum sp.]